MNVIFMSPHSDPEADLGEPDAGGQCLYEHQLAGNLSKLGIRVITFCRQTGKRNDISVINENYSIRRITTSKPQFIPKEIIERELNEFVKKVILVLKTEIGDSEKTVIHGHYWDGAKSALMLKFNYKDWPLVWTPHSLGLVKRDRFSGMQNEIQFRFLSRILWENYASYVANRIVVSSQDERQKLLTRYALVQDLTTVLSPGLDLEQFKFIDKKKARDWFGLPKNVKVFLCLGRLVPNKGYHHAIQIISELSKEILPSVRLLIVGGAKQPTSTEEVYYLNQLKQLVEKLKLQKNVIFHSAIPHNEIALVFAATDIFLMTSEEEPFGLTTIEAMASKKVVMGHYKGGTQSVIQNGKTGLLVNMQQYQETAKIIERFFSGNNERKQIENNAAEEVQKYYSWESRARDFLTVYQEVGRSVASNLSQLTKNNYFLIKNLEVT